MTETTTDEAQRSADSGTVAPATTVRVVPGFFTPRPVPASESSSPSLFRRYEMALPSWAEFQHKFAQLEKADGVDGATRPLKVVYLVRHAEGFHNQAHSKYGTERWEAEFARTDAFLDPDLTPFGIKDAQTKAPPAVAAELARGMPPIERVVVSPLSRTIQTAQNFFAKDQVPDAPFVCLEQCRETLGRHTCDKRRPLTELKRKFPDVDFSAIKDEQDVLWSPTHRETAEEIQTRAAKFLLELFREVPERHVALVVHAGFIEAVCAVVLGAEVQAENCEVIPLVLEAV